MKEEKLALIFDVGTQATRALVFDTKGDPVLIVKQAGKLYISDGDQRAEADCVSVWRDICKVSLEAKEKLGGRWNNIVAVSVTSIRNSLVFLDKDGEPTRKAIFWLDKREVDCPDKLPLFNRILYGIAGMKEVVDVQRRTCYTNWVRVNEPDVWEKTAKIVMPASYYTFKLCGKLVDSKAGQAAKFPYDYRKREWMSPRGLTFPVFGTPLEKMGGLAEPCTVIGKVTAEAAAECGLPEGTPVVASGADKACETFGVGAIDGSVASVSYGTAASVQITTEKYVEPTPFMPAYTAVAPHRFNPEIQIFRGYWMVSWFREQFALHEQEEAKARGVIPEKVLDEYMESIPPGSKGLLVQPYWGPGLTTPEARGAMLGFSDMHTRHHMYRAIIEGIDFALLEGLENMERRAGIKVKRIALSGGGSSSDAVCKIAADIFNREVYRVQTFETSGLGASMACFIAMGVFKGRQDAVENMVHVKDVFKPDPQNAAKYRELYEKAYVKIYPSVRHIYFNIYNMNKKRRL